MRPLNREGVLITRRAESTMEADLQSAFPAKAGMRAPEQTRRERSEFPCGIIDPAFAWHARIKSATA